MQRQWAIEYTHVCFARSSAEALANSSKVDIAEDKLQLAKKAGADEAFNSTDKTAQFEQALTTIVITGANAAYAGALALTANHGAVVAVGLPAQELQIPRASLLISIMSQAEFFAD